MSHVVARRWAREGTRRGLAALRAEAVGVVVAALVVGLVLALSSPASAPWATGRDAYCYWMPSLGDPYARSDWTAPVAYVYSPAFLQGLAPLRALPWPGFLALWTAVLLLAVRWLTGARLWVAGIAFATFEIAGGNIHLLLAAAIVAGFRWPAAWAFVLLTKVTPGIGLVWFAVHREWRHLAIAGAATAAVAGISFALASHAWLDWLAVLAESAGRTTGTWSAVGIPLAVRLPVAVAVVAWGARTDRRWTVPVGAMLALPALWYGSLAMLLAVIPLRSTAAPWALGPAPARAGVPAVAPAAITTPHRTSA